eukprot:2201714-Pleurochrysis_carterae.AAC.1
MVSSELQTASGLQDWFKQLAARPRHRTRFCVLLRQRTLRQVSLLTQVILPESRGQTVTWAPLSQQLPHERTRARRGGGMK